MSLLETSSWFHSLHPDDRLRLIRALRDLCPLQPDALRQLYTELTERMTYDHEVAVHWEKSPHDEG